MKDLDARDSVTAGTRKVRGYVKAELKRRKLDARYELKAAALRPLKFRLDVATADVARRKGRLSGGQMAAAERLLAQDPALLEALAKPCKKEMAK